MVRASSPLSRSARRQSPWALGSSRRLRPKVHENVKQQIVRNDELATQIVFREFNNTARVARNAVSLEIAEISRRPGATFEGVATLASGQRGRHEVLSKG
ncbi:MAG: hypothetical protein QOH68_1106 [Nocardioidaceae bacterium]|jgi:nitronate monooxygenase|nr:hypothetical protein [Nocardioidaceae bacterium]